MGGEAITSRVRERVYRSGKLLLVATDWNNDGNPGMTLKFHDENDRESSFTISGNDPLIATILEMLNRAASDAKKDRQGADDGR